MSPTGIDQSWGYADPARAAAAGVSVVAMYLSWEPSKNATAWKIRAYHQHGIGVLLNWESMQGAPLDGAWRGRLDAAEACRQTEVLQQQVGYRPKSQIAVAFSCDREVGFGQFGTVDAYYAETKRLTHAAGLLNGVYGEAALVSHLAQNGLTDMQWQTYAWSYGARAPEADFYQYQINTTLAGAAVDFDTVINAAQMGVWWPPGHPLDKPAGQIGADDMPLSDSDVQKVAAAAADEVWKQLFADRDNPKVEYSAGQLLYWGNREAFAISDAVAKLTAAVAALKVPQVVVDTVAVAADIKAKLFAALGGGA